MKKILSIGFVLLLAISLTACEKPDFLPKKEIQKIEQKVEKQKPVVEKTNDTEKKDEETTMVGNDRDKHGCIGSAGYVWDKEKQECVRPWEEGKKKMENKKKEEAVKNTENPAKKNNIEDKKVPPVVTPQKTLLILDASGSMWGQIDGKAKIEIAKEVVKKTINNFKNTELGLMAYGHRRKGDCTDIEILAKPQKDNADNISKMVDGISPKGMTPMGASVLMAAESLKYTEQKATVILVSDGIETCDVDLCELGKKLEEAGVDFTAHVIGFDMTEEQTAGLKCLASETGGTFTSAKNADSLSDALDKAVEASSCSKEKLGEAIITAPLEVEVNTEFEINWTGPNGGKDIITLLGKDDDNQNNHFDFVSYLDDKNGEVTLKAPNEVGEYDVVYFADCGTVLGRFSLKTIGTSAALTIPETIAAGSEMKISWTGPSNNDDQIGIFPKDETDWNNHLDTFSYLDSKNETGTLNVPNIIGEYDVVYWLGGKKILTRKTFEVTDVTASITVDKKINIGSKFNVKWTGPNNHGDVLSILPKGSTNWNDHIDTLGYLDSKNGEGGLTAPLEVGEYDIAYWLNQKEILIRESFTTVAVTANFTDVPASIQKETSFNIKWTGPNNHKDALTILPKGSTNWNDHLDTLGYLDSKDGEGQLTAPKLAGEYDVVYWLGGKKILTRKTFTVN